MASSRRARGAQCSRRARPASHLARGQRAERRKKARQRDRDHQEWHLGSARGCRTDAAPKQTRCSKQHARWALGWMMLPASKPERTSLRHGTWNYQPGHRAPHDFRHYAVRATTPPSGLWAAILRAGLPMFVVRAAPLKILSHDRLALNC